MSLLGDIETNLIARIESTTVLGQPLLATTRGVSGGFRPAVREAMRRERMPAAYVGFLDENIAAEAAASQRGPRFTVLIAERTLRLTSVPRLGDGDVAGAFLVVEQLRTRLEDYSPAANRRAKGVQVRFLDADDRVAWYELLLRIAPITPPPTFAGGALGGSASLTTRDVGPPDPQPFALMTRLATGVYRIADTPPLVPPAPPPETVLVWRGEFRAASPSALAVLVADVETHITAETVSTLVAASGRTFPDTQIASQRELAPRYVDPVTAEHVRPCEVVFVQTAAS